MIGRQEAVDVTIFRHADRLRLAAVLRLMNHALHHGSCLLLRRGGQWRQWWREYCAVGGWHLLFPRKPWSVVKRREEIWGLCARAANGDMAETRYADVVSGRFSAVLAVNAIE
jgi:hypothetical protein